MLDHAFRALGVAMAPWLTRFQATVLVVGGSIAGSWDLVTAPLREGLADGGAPGLRVAPPACPTRPRSWALRGGPRPMHRTGGGPRRPPMMEDPRRR
ncbi:hypothetical protein NKH18_33290 [Streptomyces sp. M10(2022)]